MITLEEQEAAAYISGDTATAALLAQLLQTKRQLEQTIAALEAIAEDLTTTKQMRGAALEGLNHVE